MKQLAGYLAAFAVVISTPTLAPAHFCPFCDAPSLTMAEQIDQSGHLLMGEWLSGEQPTTETAGHARFKVVEVAKSRDDEFKVGDEIELPQYVAGKEGARYILMGPDTKLIDWHVPSESSDSYWKYMSELPMPETDPEKQVKRLAFFLDYLEHEQLAVSNDAYGEFAAAPYEIITPLRDQMPREKLRQWITDPETPVTRMGLYGLLLGLCGNAEDAEAMKGKILVPDADFRLGIEGVMSGYLIITGADGLKVLEEAKMQAKTYTNQDGEEVKLPFSETYATMQALRFMWTYEPDRIPKDRLKQSMRTLLSRPELADLVIADLARWEDWGVQEELLAMYDNEDFDIPSIKRAIVRYFFYCSEDKVEGSEEPPQHAVSAAENLKMLEEKDPKTVRNAKRFLIR